MLPSVCLSVCLSLAAFLHYCTDPDVTLGSGKGVPPSCALLGGFAIGARVSLLWQHTRLTRNVSEDRVVLAVWLAYKLSMTSAYDVRACLRGCCRATVGNMSQQSMTSVDDSIWPINSSSSWPFNGTSISDKLQFSCSSASWLLQTCTSRFSLVKTVFVPVVPLCSGHFTVFQPHN